MYTYRVVLDAYNSRSLCDGARVVTYAQGYNRSRALARIGTVYVAGDGTVSDAITPWPGSNNLPAGPHTVRSLPEWTVVSMRVVDRPGRARVISECV